MESKFCLKMLYLEIVFSHILTLMMKSSNCQSHLTVLMLFLCVVWPMKSLQSMENLFTSQKKRLLKTANQLLIRFQ